MVDLGPLRNDERTETRAEARARARAIRSAERARVRSERREAATRARASISTGREALGFLTEAVLTFCLYVGLIVCVIAACLRILRWALGW